MTPRDGRQMFNTKVRTARGRGAHQEAFLRGILQSGSNKRDRKHIRRLPEPDVYRIKSSRDCCKSWPVRHVSKPGLISSAGNFWSLYYSYIPCCELHENDPRKRLLFCSHVLLCNRCYRVTPELMQRCVMAPLHLSLLPLLHPSTQHLRTPRRALPRCR